MKKIIITSLFLLLYSVFLAQAPEKINYQAVARDLLGNPLINQTLNVSYEIRQSSPTGTLAYKETHTVTTNQFGLFTAEIGGGTPSFGTFAGINWGTNLHYLSVLINGNLMGTSQLLSVPYALYAKQAQNGPQGVPGKNSLSAINAEPPGANCPFGGTKVATGLDDNANNILDLIEIDDTYFVCNGDTTPSGQGFWSIDANNNIYNNNFFNFGNVGIGTDTIPKPHKLTVASTDTIIASFNGTNAGGAVILVSNLNQTAPTGIVFANNQDTSALLGLAPATKFLSLINGIQDGNILISAKNSTTIKSKFIVNDADTVVFTKGNTGNVYTNNKGLFDTDSLRVGGANAIYPNYILTNNGNGNATWKDPNTLITGNPSLWTFNNTSNTLHPSVLTNKVGIGTINATTKLVVAGGSIILRDAIDVVDAIELAAGTGATASGSLSLKNGGTTTISLSGIGNSWFNTGGWIGIGTTTPSAKLDVNGTFKLGNQGNVNTKYITGQAQIIGIVFSGVGSSIYSVSIPNAVAGDYVVVTMEESSLSAPTTGLIISSASITAPNTLVIRLYNVGGAIMSNQNISVNYIIYR